MQEKAGEEIGDVAEDFLCLTREQEEMFDKALAVFIDRWLKENKIFPKFYKVENAKEFKMDYAFKV